MQRVREDGPWTLFSPDETPELHDFYGPDFKLAYELREARAAHGELTVFKQMRRRPVAAHLTIAVRDRPPWITFKDPCTLRSPQQHCGVVHSSNCAPRSRSILGRRSRRVQSRSVNLVNHVTRRASTVQTGAHGGDGDAHAGQSAGRKLLHHPGSAPLNIGTVRWVSASWLPRMRCKSQRIPMARMRRLHSLTKEAMSYHALCVV